MQCMRGNGELTHSIYNTFNIQVELIVFIVVNGTTVTDLV